MIDVVATLEKLGIETKPGAGSELSGHCPMHKQRTGQEDLHPSWSINSITGLFICYSCGYKGSILTLISDMTGMTLDEAKTQAVKPDMLTTVEKIPEAHIKVRKEKTYDDSVLAQYRRPPSWARRRRHVSAEACELFDVRWEHCCECWILPIRSVDGPLLGWQQKGETSRVFRNYPAGVKK